MAKSVLRNRADRLIVVCLAAFFLGLYLTTLAPGLLGGDAGEFQFAAWRLGLAHATGYPLYLLLGSAWQHAAAWFGVAPAAALNGMNAVIGALGVVLLYLTMRRWLHGPVQLARIVAAFTAAYFGINPSFWSQSVIAEVYPLHVVLVLAIFLAAQAVENAYIQNARSPVPSIMLLFLAIGVALTHHAMTVWLLPGVVLYLFLVDRRWWCSWSVCAGALLALALPLLLYLYIPLRSGSQASPWLHQSLNGLPLRLYENDWASFVGFISGSSIAVGFHDLAGAWREVAVAGAFWWQHFSWFGLLMALLGVYVLVRRREWGVLALTVPVFLFQQVFNLFYAIDDIFVYYIPLYLMATIWIGFAVLQLEIGDWRFERDEGDLVPMPHRAGLAAILALLALVLMRQVLTFLPVVDQSGNVQARAIWESILAADPPANAILISNDRNEIVPLFYLQAVEGRGEGMTGLFSGIRADGAFSDIGATVETALAQTEPDTSCQPVFLIKEMPGLEARFALQPADSPLVEVVGPAAAGGPAIAHDDAYGPLQLVGLDWTPSAGQVDVALYWKVVEPLGADYTTTVQLFSAQGDKVGQDDRPPGGVFYPTSLWKPGETLVDRHTITLSSGDVVDSLLVALYSGPELEMLAPPLRLDAPR